MKPVNWISNYAEYEKTISRHDLLKKEPVVLAEALVVSVLKRASAFWVKSKSSSGEQW
jgi:hypothetical protein